MHAILCGYTHIFSNIHANICATHIAQFAISKDFLHVLHREFAKATRNDYSVLPNDYQGYDGHP